MKTWTLNGALVDPTAGGYFKKADWKTETRQPHTWTRLKSTDTRIIVVTHDVDISISLNAETQRWEVWCRGLCEDFITRPLAMLHVRQLGMALGLPRDWLNPTHGEFAARK